MNGKTIIAAGAILAILLAASCAGSGTTALPADPMTLPELDAGNGSEYVLGADGRIKVFIWDGDTPIKRITIYPTGEVLEETVDPSWPRNLEQPQITVVSFQDRDFYRVPLRGLSPLAYSRDYVIGPTDELEISVWRNEEISGRVLVRPDGRITLPLVNDVVAAGLTRAQLQAKLVEMYQEFIAEPEITVNITESNSYQVYVQGRVRQPGAFPIRQTTTLVQAIAMAGDFDEWADTSRILIVRRTPAGERRFIVNYRRIIRQSDPEPDLVLQPGDTIIVP